MDPLTIRRFTLQIAIASLLLINAVGVFAQEPTQSQPATQRLVEQGISIEFNVDP